MTDPAPDLRRQLADDIADAEAAIVGANDELDRLAAEAADWVRRKERQIERRDQARRYLAMLPPEAPAAAKPAKPPRAPRGAVQDEILTLLAHGQRFPLDEIPGRVYGAPKSVRAALRRLVEKGRIVEEGGRFSLAPKAEARPIMDVAQ